MSTAYLDRLSAVEISADDLAVALKMFAELGPQDRGSMEGRALRLIRYFHDELGMSADDRVGEKVHAIECRLEALASLRDSREMAPWVLPSGEAESDLVSHILLEAAAKEPLKPRGKYKVTFHRKSFFDRVLLTAEMEGCA